MAESIATAYLTLVPKMQSGWESGVSASVSSAGTAAGTGFGTSFGSTLKSIAGMAIVAEAANAVAETFTSAFTGYAEREQLVGGVETLFKDSADIVEEYAANAYETAGLSANEYMETVTSFSASLLQSLGGDTEEAADMADLAITDMSDNANKMGTDMESIQNAYQGFAKQNYTMLDNLKLGYGGTKEEMQRLIDDANELRKTQGKDADLTIESYADIVTAIHEVQDEMGITGTTSQEASKTVSGSISKLSSAWDNFLTGLGDPEADIDDLADKCISAAADVVSNAGPVAASIVSKFGDIFDDDFPKKAGQAMSDLVVGFGTWIADNGPEIVAKGLDIAVNLLNGIVDGIVQSGSRIIDAVLDAVGVDMSYSDVADTWAGTYGYAEGGYFTQATPIVIGEGSSDEVALPLTAGVLSGIGRGIVQASGGGMGGGDTYIINGITYDDGSAAQRAVSDLVRAANIRKRAM